MSIDVAAFRLTVGQFVTGVTVIVIDVDGEIKAMTANAFTSLSLDPPLILFCASKASKTGQLLHAAEGFSVNILRRDQHALSTYFAGGWKEPTRPAFHFVAWDGGPRLEGCAASLGCATHAIVEGGDHWIAIGRVIALHRGIEPPHPLVFFRGRYGSLAHTASEPAPDLQLGSDPILADYW
jgi:3-hydroxy-9,10-secoandrosta-1,3,5(10)-triene-9,17-dione monooxygenase reductase component